MSEGKQIYDLLPCVSDAVGAIGKNKKTNFGDRYSFRSIDDVLAHCHAAFVEYGITVMPEVLEARTEQRQTSRGKPAAWVLLTVKHTFYAPDGSSVSCVTVGEAQDSGDKASNKAMSGAYKYALTLGLCLPVDGLPEVEQDNPDLAAAENQPAKFGRLVESAGIDRKFAASWAEGVVGKPAAKISVPGWDYACAQFEDLQQKWAERDEVAA